MEIMELKKYPKYDLSLKIGMFRNLGLTISLGLIILAFELPGNGQGNIIDLTMINEEVEEIVNIPPTIQPPPPKPPIQIRDIREIPNEAEIEEDIEIELDVEVTESTIIEEIMFTMGEMGEEEIEEIFTIVEDAPEFPGGIQAFYDFIGKNLKYPSRASRVGIQGKVFVQFVVDKDGSLRDIEVVRGVSDSCDKEAIRVMKLVPKFKPGKQRGKPVKVRMVVPIVFKLIQ